MEKELTLKQIAETNEYNELQKNVIIAFYELCDAAEHHNSDGLDINAGLCEVTFEGKTYQVQLSFIGNRKSWVKENGVRFSEVVKIHD